MAAPADNPPAIDLFGYLLLLIYTGTRQLLEKADKKYLVGLLRTIAFLPAGQDVNSCSCPLVCVLFLSRFT
jgi:hypothetical protein